MPLIHVDTNAILGELVDLKSAMVAPQPGACDPVAWESIRDHVLRLRALLLDEPALAENVSPHEVRRLKAFLDDLDATYHLSSSEGEAFVAMEADVKRATGFIRYFHEIAEQSRADEADTRREGSSMPDQSGVIDPERVTDAARVCCQHLYSFHRDAPHNPFFSVQFDESELRAAMEAGQAAIQPHRDDFGKAAVTVTLPGGGRGVQMCGITRQTSHGLAFALAEKLLDSLERGDGTAFYAHGDVQDLWVRIRNEARDVAELMTSDQPLEEPPQVEYYVTLRQMAAIVSKSKRTLERLRDLGTLPAPKVKGGKGKADEWKWSEVRPILVREYNRPLPEVFPGDRFIRR